MLIRVRGYNSGFREYFRTGKKADNHLHRDDLDKRIILYGDIDITHDVVEMIPDSGSDRYLHIAVPFKEDYISEEGLHKLIGELKTLLMHGYNDEEYCFYAEAHIPKIKRVLNESTGALESRRPHIHIVIPKVNLLDGSYLNPFGYYQLNEKYIEAIQEVLNHKYGFESPRDNPRSNINDYSDFISRYKGDLFKSDVRGFKENLLSELIQNKDINYQSFVDLLKSKGQVKLRNPGHKEYLNVKPDGFSKGVNLKDAVFSKWFLDLDYDDKVQFLTSKFVSRDELKKQRDFDSDSVILNEWLKTRSHEIKLLHPSSKEYKNYKGLSEAEKELCLESLIQKNNQAISEQLKAKRATAQCGLSALIAHSLKGKIDVRRNVRIRGRNQNKKPGLSSIDELRRFRGDPEAGAYLFRDPLRKLFSRELDSSLFQKDFMLLQAYAQSHLGEAEHRIPSSVRFPAARIDHGAGRAVGPGAGLDDKWTPPYSVSSDVLNVTLTQRLADNVTESIRTDIADRLVASSEKVKSKWQVIREQLNAAELLTCLEYTHGIDRSNYGIGKSKSGEDRIICRSRSYSVNDFLTKEMNMNWSEASLYLTTEYDRQKRDGKLNPFRQPYVSQWASFKAWERSEDSKSQAWAELKAEHAERRSAMNKVFRLKNKSIYSDQTLSAIHKKQALTALRLEKLRAQQVQKHQFSEEKKELRRELSTRNRYQAFLRMKAEEGNADALRELRRLTSKNEQPDNNYFENVADPTTVLFTDVSYTVKSNGSVTYLLDGSEAVTDARGWVSVLQVSNDDAIELAIRVALEKNRYKPLSVNGDNAFVLNIIRVAKERDLYVNFEDPEINRLYKNYTDNDVDARNQVGKNKRNKL